MNNILLGIFFLILGLLFANMLTNICGSRDLVEGLCTDSDECLNGGTCPEGEGGGERVCTCAAGWTGNNCEHQTFEGNCDPNPCMNGGVCTPIGFPGVTNYYCLCAGGLGGNCEEKVPVASDTEVGEGPPPGNYVLTCNNDQIIFTPS